MGAIGRALTISNTQSVLATLVVKLLLVNLENKTTKPSTSGVSNYFDGVYIDPITVTTSGSKMRLLLGFY